MKTSRLEAFSDGVIAIIITIMVLEFEVPHGFELKDIEKLLPNFLAYIFSFFYVGIYWNNHHHLWQAVNKVSGNVLWANLHLLFWLSLLPFATGWIGANLNKAYPVAFYGVILLMASIAWYILAYLIKKQEGEDSLINKAFKKDTKTLYSMLTYFIAVDIAFFLPYLSIFLYILVAVIWVIPDKRIERKIGNI